MANIFFLNPLNVIILKQNLLIFKDLAHQFRILLRLDKIETEKSSLVAFMSCKHQATYFCVIFVLLNSSKNVFKMAQNTPGCIFLSSYLLFLSSSTFQCYIEQQSTFTFLENSAGAGKIQTELSAVIHNVMSNFHFNLISNLS